MCAMKQARRCTLQNCICLAASRSRCTPSSAGAAQAGDAPECGVERRLLKQAGAHVVVEAQQRQVLGGRRRLRQRGVGVGDVRLVVHVVVQRHGRVVNVLRGTNRVRLPATAVGAQTQAYAAPLCEQLRLSWQPPARCLLLHCTASDCDQLPELQDMNTRVCRMPALRSIQRQAPSQVRTEKRPHDAWFTAKATTARWNGTHTPQGQCTRRGCLGTAAAGA